MLTNLRGRAERGEILPVHGELCQGFEKTLRAILSDRQALDLRADRARSLPWLAADAHLHTSGAPAESFAGKPTALADSLAIPGCKTASVPSSSAPRLRAFARFCRTAILPENPLQGLYAPTPGPSPVPGEGRKSQIPPLPERGRGQGGGGVQGGVALVNGVLRSGFRLTDAKLVVLTDAEIFGNASDRAKGKRREFREGMRITSLLRTQGRRLCRAYPPWHRRLSRVWSR